MFSLIDEGHTVEGVYVIRLALEARANGAQHSPVFIPELLALNWLLQGERERERARGRGGDEWTERTTRWRNRIYPSEFVCIAEDDICVPARLCVCVWCVLIVPRDTPRNCTESAKRRGTSKRRRCVENSLATRENSPSK